MLSFFEHIGITFHVNAFIFISFYLYFVMWNSFDFSIFKSFYPYQILSLIRFCNKQLTSIALKLTSFPFFFPSIFHCELSEWSLGPSMVQIRLISIEIEPILFDVWNINNANIIRKKKSNIIPGKLISFIFFHIFVSLWGRRHSKVLMISFAYES